MTTMYLMKITDAIDNQEKLIRVDADNYDSALLEAYKKHEPCIILEVEECF